MTLDEWNHTFVVPKFLVVKPSIRCSLSSIRQSRLDHPFGYRKVALQQKNKRTKPSSLETPLFTPEYSTRLVPARTRIVCVGEINDVNEIYWSKTRYLVCRTDQHFQLNY